LPQTDARGQSTPREGARVQTATSIEGFNGKCGGDDDDDDDDDEDGA